MTQFLYEHHDLDAIYYYNPHEEEVSQSRRPCSACGKPPYENGINIASTLPVWEEKILLVMRARGERAGYWTLPGGHNEKRETVPETAIRETQEESGAEIKLGALFAIYHLPDDDRNGLTQHIYRAELLSLENLQADGHETRQVGLFHIHDLPMTELAFPTDRRALTRLVEIWDTPHPPVDEQTFRRKSRITAPAPATPAVLQQKKCA